MPPAVVGVATNEPVPVVAPMVFPVTVPTFTFPEVILIPHRIPLSVAAPLLVLRLMDEIVFP